jgi:hypothetical protein
MLMFFAYWCSWRSSTKILVLLFLLHQYIGVTMLVELFSVAPLVLVKTCGQNWQKYKKFEKNGAAVFCQNIGAVISLAAIYWWN